MGMKNWFEKWRNLEIFEEEWILTRKWGILSGKNGLIVVVIATMEDGPAETCFYFAIHGDLAVHST